jgi:hypothetical protein
MKEERIVLMADSSISIQYTPAAQRRVIPTWRPSSCSGILPFFDDGQTTIPCTKVLKK